jgi:ATP-binding cassette subfamily C (CFTR/MRP) protein 1
MFRAVQRYCSRRYVATLLGRRLGFLQLTSCTQISICLLLILHIAFLISVATTPGLRHPASLAASTLTVAGAGVALVASFYEHTRSVAPSSVLQTYYLTVILLDVARVRTLWLMDSATPAILLSLILGFGSLTFLLESLKKTKYLTVNASTEEQSGIWDRALFSWLLSMLLRGYSGTLTLASLPAVDSKLDSKALHGQLVKSWHRSKNIRNLRKRSDLTCTRSIWQQACFVACNTPRLLATVCCRFLP